MTGKSPAHREPDEPDGRHTAVTPRAVTPPAVISPTVTPPTVTPPTVTSAASLLAPAYARLAVLPLIVLLALTAAACGGDDGEPVAADGDGSTTTAELPPDDGEGSEQESGDGVDGGDLRPVVEDDEGYEPTRPMLDMTDPQPHPIDDVVVAADGATLGVRYEAATEPCSGAVAEVTETADTVTVELATGLNPDAATMSCIAQVVRYELAVPLDAPLGERELLIGPESDAASDGSSGGTGDASPAPSEPGGDEGEGATPPPSSTQPPPGGEPPADSGLSPAGDFVGLPLDDAGRKADGEGRAWRIGREDDELFALTADYDPDRLTFEVDDGIVTEAVGG